MNAELQSRCWACLPKEVREEIKNDYKSECADFFDRGYNNALEDLFGHHNLTSDTEPEEMLMVERKTISDIYEANERIIDGSQWSDDHKDNAILVNSLFETLFGDKCLPDTPNPPISVGLKPQSDDGHPKFNKGDSVLHVPTQIVYDVVEYIQDRQRYKLQRMSGVVTAFAKESDLETYIGPKTKDAYGQYQDAKAEEFNNQLKDNRKALYDALYELESASKKVRKALISLQ